MGAALGLLLGAGLFCVWWSTWTPDTARTRPRGGWHDRVTDALVQAGMGTVNPTGLVGVCAGCGLLVAGLVGLLASSPAVGLCFGAMASTAPWFVVKTRARRHRTLLRGLWPEVVDHLASGVRAGLSLPEALASLGEQGPEPLREPFRRFAADWRVSGNFTESLTALKADLADPVADRVVEALRITRDVGGTDLGRLLRTLSEFLREDLRTRDELEARQSWTVNGARLAVGAPWLVLALLATRPGALAAYNTPTGAVVLILGAVCTVLAYTLMRRLGRLPEEKRVLR